VGRAAAKIQPTPKSPPLEGTFFIEKFYLFQPGELSMLINKTFKLTLLGAAVLALAACATTGNGGSGAAGGGSDQGGANASGATSSGTGEMTSFNGTAGAGQNDPMKVGNQSYYFDYDKSDVHDTDQASIKVQATYLIAHPNAKVRLEGNTDNRGSREYNIALGNRRAQAVASVLAMDGVSKAQISTVSYGAEKPVALGDNEDAWAKNRRVDLVYTTPIK
jgi:peptidoglycan-associated lipoprotein